jgi:hypothetical protein
LEWLIKELLPECAENYLAPADKVVEVLSQWLASLDDAESA